MYNIPQNIPQIISVINITSGHGMFSPVAPTCTPISYIPSPWAHLSPLHILNGISIGLVFLHNSGRAFLYFTMGRPFSLLKLPLHMEDLVPHPIHGSLGPSKSTTQMASRSVQPFFMAQDRDRPTEEQQ